MSLTHKQENIHVRVHVVYGEKSTSHINVFCVYSFLSNVMDNWVILEDNKGVAMGRPGVPPPPPLCKPFFKEATYNVPWRKRHDDNV